MEEPSARKRLPCGRTEDSVVRKDLLYGTIFRTEDLSRSFRQEASVRKSHQRRRRLRHANPDSLFRQKKARLSANKGNVLIDFPPVTLAYD